MFSVVLQRSSECYDVLHSVTKCYDVLLSVTFSVVLRSPWCSFLRSVRTLFVVLRRYS